MTEPTQLDRIEALLADIRELLAWAPGVPQHLWTEGRSKAAAEAQAERQEFARQYGAALINAEVGGILFVDSPTEQKV